MQPVLIVEDNQDLQNIYKVAFENSGIPVVIKESGLEAMAEIKKINPSLILLDLLMPDIDGIKFMKMISANNQAAYPTIICSNLSSKETIDECKSLGCIDYIIKADVDIGEIVNKVRAFLEKQMAEKKENQADNTNN